MAAHLNGQRGWNYSDNIAWVTGSENEAHKALHGTRRAGENSPHAKLTDEDVRLIRAHVAFGATMAATARLFGVGFSTVQRIIKGHARADAGGYM